MIKLKHLPIDFPNISSPFGPRNYRIMKWHNGVDYKVVEGTPVYAVADGKVEVAKNNPGGYGLYVVINHKNIFGSLYGHLSKYIVSVGQEVKAGDIIGLSGNTGDSIGPHLHFEIRFCEYSQFWQRCHADSSIYMYCINPHPLVKNVSDMNALTLNQATEIVQKQAELENRTINYIKNDYRFGEALIMKLAKAIM